MTSAYAAGDPRTQLAPSASGTRAQGDDVLPFQHVELAAEAPSATSALGSRTWVVRAQNVVVAWDHLVAGETIERDDVDEVMLLVLGGTAVVEREGEREALAATSVVTIPPGPWRATAEGDASVLRLHAVTATDVVALASNRDRYDPAPSSIAIAEPWPAPVVEGRLHVYRDLDAIGPEPGRMGRILRGRHVMVNVLHPRVGPRDPRSLSPHDHDDFEQLSIAYEGSYVHHIRAHWGSDRTQWRDDAHVASASPSIAVIPPPLVHTSEAVGEGANRMIDVFAGPRADFSARPGWVLNAADYPAPEGVA